MRTNQIVSSRFGQIGKGMALAGAIAAVSLTTPTPAHAGGNGVGAAIGLGILGGVIAALNAGRAVDRIISVTGLSLATVPEFVSGIVLIVVFGVELKVLPVTASLA